MAFTDFYMQSGGDNLNAGSTTDNAAPHTYAGGTFVRATGIFTVASGDPVADGVVAGDWVSIYTTAGAVAATFVGKCTSRTSVSITVEITTNKLGVTTSVSETAAAATAKVGGAWASEVVLASGGLGSFTMAFDAKVNIKAATYTITASRTFQMIGTSVFSFWFSGYNTTPGDLDNDTTNSLAKPLWSCNSGVVLTFTTTANIVSGLSITGTINANFVVVWNGARMQISRCRVENTNSGTNAPACQVAQAGIVFEYCYFKSPTTTTSNPVVYASAQGCFIGCVFDSGGKAGLQFDQASPNNIVIDCVFLNNTGSGILTGTGSLQVFRCTFSATTVDGIKWTGTPGLGSFIVACIFRSCVTTGINQASGTNNRDVLLACNDFFNCGTNVVGITSNPFFPQTDSSDPVTSASNMTPVVGANARAHGFPGIFENQSYSSFVNIGAVMQTIAGSETSSVFGG